MECTIIYPQESRVNHAYQLIRKHAKKFGIELKLEFITPEIKVSTNIAIMRGYDFTLSQKLEANSIKVINSTIAMQNCLNKQISYNIFKQYGIPTPATYTLTANQTYQEACEIIGSKCFIVKSPTGSKGKEVWLINNLDQFEQIKSQTKESLLLQEYIANSSGRDIRVWVAGDKASAAVMRQNKNSFKSNLACGATATPYPLTTELRELAITSSKALGLELCAVDILLDKESYKVCEVNGNAGFRSAYNQGHENILDDMFKYIQGLF